MRNRYQQAGLRQEPGERGALGQWLLDNFYLLEGEYLQALRSLRDVRDKDGVCLLAQVWAEGFCARRLPVAQREAGEFLRQLCACMYLSFEQLSLCEAALRAALLHTAHSALALPAEAAAAAIGYAVGGLRDVGSVDFVSLTASVSAIEAILLRDPSGVYPRMDKESRTGYRELVYRIARRTGTGERTVAEKAVASAAGSDTEPQNHVGYHLLYHPALKAQQGRHRAFFLWGSVLCTLLPALACALLAGSPVPGLLLLLPLYEPVREIMQGLSLRGLPPVMLPRMDLQKVPAAEAYTLVTVSALLDGKDLEKRLEERLEGLYLSNRTAPLGFLLLGDLPAADRPQLAKDSSALDGAQRAVERLNERYGQRFFLFVRARSWSPTEESYSGWERKRGAIGELVRYLHGEETSACRVVGDLGVMRSARYLLALDSDTRLHFDTAALLIASALHPLCRPRLDAETGYVKEGYGILIPRLCSELCAPNATPFARLMTGCGGVSGYDQPGRDAYQDLFGQAIFTGKGLIDLNCFYKAGLCLPPGQVLGHDILEGGLLGCGLVGEVEMSDGEPQTFSSWLRRAHRWMRGDWQNLLFLRRSFRLSGKRYRYRTKGVVRLQLVNNLLRSLAPVMAALALLLSPLMGSRAAAVLAGGVFLAVAGRPVLGALRALWRGGAAVLLRRTFSGALPQVYDQLGRAAFWCITLFARAQNSLDAMLRALWRTFASRKHLLEWTTAAQSEGRRDSLPGLLRRFLLPEALGVLLLLFGRYPALRLWGLVLALLVPFAHRTARRGEEAPTAGEHYDELRGYVADMVRFYDDYATAQRHFLPPDNVQLAPRYALAERTSPTNIGFMLLSWLAARDFELIDTPALLGKVGGTIDTLLTLETWNGHLYNWYDLRDLRVLHPAFVSSVDSGNLVCCLVALRQGLREYGAPGALLEKVGTLIARCDFSPLYDKARGLFSIGYDREEEKLSASHYDFLMSEARLLSYYAVATRQAGRKHWGNLSRTLSRCGPYQGPLSWTGTMFEYFMPHLLLPAYQNSLLHEALCYCLYCQRRRTGRLGLPWGISESGYYRFDNQLNYQYKAHGVQALGVKQGLDDELVLSPYSTFLALPFAPKSALRNLERLRESGLYADYGFYEAADCTPSRVGERMEPVRSFMAHHLGMSVVACANAALGNVMQRRFLADKTMASAAQFLQERIPKEAVVIKGMKQKQEEKRPQRSQEDRLQESFIPSPTAPRMTLLSGGLQEVLTDCGAGHLQLAGLDLTAREEDLLSGGMGIFCLARAGEELVSATAAPLYIKGQNEAVFEEERALFTGRGEGLELTMECRVCERESAALRTITVRSKSKEEQEISLLLYLEPTLLRDRDFSAHRSFARLFVTCRYDGGQNLLHFTRRQREGGEGYHLCAGFLEEQEFEFETDKIALLRPPLGLQSIGEFADRPFRSRRDSPNAVCALRLRFLLREGEGRTLRFALAAGKDETAAKNAFAALREGPLSFGRCPLMDGSAEGMIGLRLLPKLFYARPLQKKVLRAIEENRQGRQGLWGLSISGDYPIVTLPEEECGAGLPLCLLRLQRRLRQEGIPFDLVLLAKDAAHREELQREILAAGYGQSLEHQGGAFLLDGGALSKEQRTLLYAWSCYLSGKSTPTPPQAFLPARVRPALADPVGEEGLSVYGGVFDDGRFTVNRRSWAPYCHVLANPTFGTLLSDGSLGFSWAINARENKLSPWWGDPARDNRGERLFLKAGGEFYDPVWGARASFGRSGARYEGTCGALHCTVTVRVPERGNRKEIAVSLENTGEQELPVLLAYYLEPVLGVERGTARMITGSAMPGGIVMKNESNTAVPGFCFLGTNAKNARPCFSRRRMLAGEWDQPGHLPGPDPCGALIVPKVLPPRRKEKVTFVLTFARREEAARKLAQLPLPRQGREEHILLETPDRYLNAFYNTLLHNQITASRLYGRTGFYQCSGAYGFRDQLQDAMNLALGDTQPLKVQIARCCAVQFLEGDVLHWWHRLPGERPFHGVRSRYSDDLLWLPLAIAEYLQKSGDESLLKKEIAYLAGEELREDEHERYFSPVRGACKESVYRHGLRALERGHNLSERGLAKIGGGDWNDGYSSVGSRGKGESVWLSLFLSMVLERYAPVCERMGESEAAERCRLRSAALRGAVDRHAWDGEWYARATFDSGEVMGSKESAECKIDSLPQSFALLAGMPDRERVDTALESAYKLLVDEEDMIVRLFWPPFEHSDPSPGYVQAYPRGIRENGGQYTHAAVWLAQAYLQAGWNERGWRLLQILNPAYRASDSKIAARYALEPYYIAADIYVNPALYGRGGWSIYTGAAGWFYRVAAEDLLGLRREGNTLALHPCLPPQWEGAKVLCHIGGSALTLRYCRLAGRRGLYVDGVARERILLDGRPHEAEYYL